MATVTQQDVLTAIEQLEAEGKSATNDAIRNITGGSNATVQKHRKAIFDQRAAQVAREAIILKETEVRVLTDAFATLLKQRVDGIQTSFAGDLKQLIDSLTQASSEVDSLTQKLMAQEVKITGLMEEGRTLRNNLDFVEKSYREEKLELQAEIKSLSKEAYTQKGRADVLEERLKQYEGKELPR